MVIMAQENFNFKWTNLIFVWVILGIILFSSFIGLYTDFLWYDTLGFASVFLIGLKSRIWTFLAFGSVFFLFIMANLLIGRIFEPKNAFLPFKFKVYVLAIISVFIGLSFSAGWFNLLQYFNAETFNITDPILLKDVSFYVYTLPVLNLILSFGFVLLFLTILFVISNYIPHFIEYFSAKSKEFDLKDGKVTYNQGFKSIFKGINRGPIIHSAILLSLIFVLFAIRNYLSIFSIMYSEKGIVVGAGYADVMAYLPMVKILLIFAVLVTILFYVWIFVISKSAKLQKKHIVIYAVLIYFVVSIVGPTLVPLFVQNFIVSPNELNLEKPYILNNINFTKMAYGLDDVNERDFPANMNLNSKVLRDEKATIDNIRILDYRPLIKTYQQTQEIRLYYDMSEIDIDRYTIDGKYTQVMLSARELDQRQIAENAKTWVNLHLVYTHGYGLVMSPVNKVTKQGLPDYLIKDIPPVYSTEDPILNIENPKIYYGEVPNNFVLVNTKTDEFDYPKGNLNEYTNYEGKGGIVLDSFFKKVLMAIKFKDLKILLTGDITDQSRIMMYRNIQERISKVTPFLRLDNDPYMVVADGQLYWVQDAYTATNNFPYSEKFYIDRYNSINYIRNSVKIVLSAYDGTINYYAFDTKDPMLKTFSNVYPGLFEDISLMPESIKSHIRYPEDLFKVQSEIYSTYHMTDPTVFYNKEDSWQIPTEVYGTGQQIRVEPYYVIMKLPGEGKEEEFVLMTSFTPIRKNNMISWLAVRNDGENYGQMIVYKFPKDSLVFGPLQIEAKFDQDSTISQQLTLWSQQGSSVTRGNLLVIPIQDSLLYVEPLYIQAETGQLPELKRILVSDGESVVMEENLQDALAVLFEGKKTSSSTGSSSSTSPSGGIDKSDDVNQILGEANKYYQNILDAMQNNNWDEFGDNFDKLGQTLEQAYNKTG